MGLALIITNVLTFSSNESDLHIFWLHDCSRSLAAKVYELRYMNALHGSPADKLKLRDLIHGLTILQIWGLLVTVAGLISGSCILGYTANAKLNEASIARLQAESDSAKKQLAALNAKATFLDRHARYLEHSYLPRASGLFNLDPSKISTYHKQMAGLYADLIYNWWYQQQPGAILEQRLSQHINKGLAATSGSWVATIKFECDGSEWAIPEEIKEIVNKRAAPNGSAATLQK